MGSGKSSTPSCARFQHISQASAARKSDRLRELTAELFSVKPDATAEYARFLSIRQRGLCLPEAQLTERLAGATIMVTGGTGCIGSALMTQLAARNPGRLVSVTRGVTTPWERCQARST